MHLIFVLDFIALVIVLSSLRQKLVYELSGASLLLFRTTKPGIVLYSLLVLPGTIIHELSHWIVAEVLGVQTGRIKILPDFEEDESGTRRLGYVAVAKSDPFRAFLIGIAPFISGLLILLVLGRVLNDIYAQSLWWVNGLIFYAIMVIGNSMMISESDRRTWPFIIVFFVFVGIMLTKQTFFDLNSIYSYINMSLKSINSVLLVTAGLNLVMIMGSYAIRRLIEKTTGNRIIHK